MCYHCATMAPKEKIYLFGVRFQHCTGHITTGSWKGRGNQYKQLVKVLYCKLPTNGKQLPAFPLEAMPGTEPRPQRWEARVLPLCHRVPSYGKEGGLLVGWWICAPVEKNKLMRSLLKIYVLSISHSLELCLFI